MLTAVRAGLARGWLIGLMLIAAGQSLATPGDIDQRFGTGGMVVTNFGWNADFARARVAFEQSDGRIVLAGVGRSFRDAFAMARFHSDGSLDSSFGDDGRVVTRVGNQSFPVGSDAGVHAVVQQADGKLVVGGQAGGTPYGVAAILVRYEAGGDLDPTFGVAGQAVVPLLGYTFLVGLGQQSDGKLIAISYGFGNSSLALILARFDVDGRLDASFGSGGVVTAEVGFSNLFATARQADDKYILAGNVQSPNGTQSAIAVARFNANGSVDTSFGNAGVVITSVRSYDAATAVVVQDDGNIVVTGYSSNGSGADVVLVRYQGNGALDSTFGNGGVTITPQAGTQVASGIVQQASGDLVVSGTSANAPFLKRYHHGGAFDADLDVATTPAANLLGALSLSQRANGNLLLVGEIGDEYQLSQLAMAQFEPAGAIDEAFGSDGVAAAGAGDSYDYSRSLIVQDDGKLVAVGTSFDVGRSLVVLARYDADGSLDPTFGIGGKLRLLDPGTLDAAAGGAQQANGKLLIGGTVDSNTGGDFALARYELNGALDTTFGVGGMVRTSFDTPSESAQVLLQQPDGKVVLGGTASTAGGAMRLVLVRYHADGGLDPGFGVGGVSQFTPAFVPSAILRQADGKLVLAGGGDSWVALGRWNSDGTIDASFGPGGVFFYVTTIGSAGAPVDVLQQPDLKLVVVSGNRILRFQPNGALDNTFAGGIVTNPSTFTAVAQLPDGTLLAAGNALTAYRPNGSLDTSFGTGGVSAMQPGFGGIIALERLSSTNLVALGQRGLDFALVRYTTQDCGNGRLDSGEACDDGAISDGDGCTRTCTVEAGWSCTGTPSACTSNGTATIPPPSPSPTPTVPPLPSNTPTWSATPSPSLTSTLMATATTTPTNTATASATATVTTTTTSTTTATRSATATRTPPPSRTASPTRTTTPTRTATFIGFCGTTEGTCTPTATRTFTPSRTSTPTRTSTFVGYCGDTQGTCTPTATRTFTATRTPTPTFTATLTGYCGGVAGTCTPTATRTFTPTRTATFVGYCGATQGTCTPTATRTFTPTRTPTFVGYCGATQGTCTPTATRTFTPTRTPTFVGYCGATQGTCTPTATRTFTPTRTATSVG